MRRQVYFKTNSNEGSWTTYFQSFTQDVWLAYAVGLTTVLIIMSAFWLNSKRNQSLQGHTDKKDEVDYFGICITLFGILCQQGK